jgi:hypothetical protein
MIHDEICTYEVARLAKEKGFPQAPNENNLCDIYCWDNLRKIHTLCISAMWHIGEYSREDMYAAPTQSLLQRWLREEKGIQICIDNELDFDNKDFIYEWRASLKKEFRQGCFTIDNPSDMEFYPTYEEALTAALKYALENLI